MKNLSKALLNLAAFVELSSEDTVDPDAATAALEQLAADLKTASEAEIEYLKAAIRQEAVQAGQEPTDGERERLDFFFNFLENAGLE